jgi:3-methyl-2-oxobutanoate hydroxymethyltransferase
LRPQSIHQLGRSTIQGKTAEQAESILEDALALEKAGAFAIVLELVTEEAARYVSARLKVPTIGIGSGAGCDGQVLVSYDMIGMFENISMKFLKKYINLHHDLLQAFKSYRREVKEGMYPGPKNVHKMSEEEASKLPVSDEESDEDNQVS